MGGLDHGARGLDPRRGLVDCNGQNAIWGHRLEAGESDSDCDGCVVVGGVVVVVGVRSAAAVVCAPDADVLSQIGPYGFRRTIIGYTD